MLRKYFQHLPDFSIKIQPLLPNIQAEVIEMTDKSALMVAYNTAKPMVDDVGRLNRGFGIAQSNLARQTATFMVYATTIYSCKCADSFYRKVVCKHRLALALLQATEG